MESPTNKEEPGSDDLQNVCLWKDSEQHSKRREIKYINFIRPTLSKEAAEKIPVKKFQKGKGIVWLTNNTYESWLKTHHFTLVLYTAAWCGSCPKLINAFIAIEQMYRRNQVDLWDQTMSFAFVQYPNEPSITRALEIPYPGWVALHRGVYGTQHYNGLPNTEEILSFIQRSCQPPSAYLQTQEEVTEFLQHDDVVVGFLPNKESLLKVFFDASLLYMNELTFGLHLMNDGNAADAEIKMIRASDGAIVSTHTIDDTLIKWIAKQNRHNLVMKGRPEYFEVDAKRLPALYLFVDISLFSLRLYDSSISIIKEVAQCFRDKMNFFYLDGNEYKHFNKKLGLNGAIPSIAVIDLAKERHYVFNGNVSYEEVKAFCNAVLNNRWPPFTKKRQPSLEPHLSTMREEGIVRLNSDNLDSFVFDDEDTNVLLLLTTPWCGYCKGFWPIYEALRKEFIDNRKTSDLLFAVYDVTERLPSSIMYTPTGIPDLLFFPASHKDKFIRFTDRRTLTDLILFLESHLANQQLLVNAAPLSSVEPGVIASSDSDSASQHGEQHGEDTTVD